MAQQATALSEERDTEITLGTGKLLAMFFAAVVICGVFFGLGFNLGRASAPQPDPNLVAAAPLTAAPGAAKPTATRPLAPPPAVVTEPAQTPGVQNAGSIVPAPQPAPAPELKPVAGTPEANSASGF